MTKTTRGMFCFAVGVVALAGAAMAAGTFDGRYTGPQKTMVNSNRGPCQGLDHDVTVAVSNSTITWPWGRGDPLVATVQADGSFYAQVKGIQGPVGFNAVNELKGRITAGVMEADVGGTACQVHWSLRKTG
jgi:hypothetical protein